MKVILIVETDDEVAERSAFEVLNGWTKNLVQFKTMKDKDVKITLTREET